MSRGLLIAFLAAVSIAPLAEASVIYTLDWTSGPTDVLNVQFTEPNYIAPPIDLSTYVAATGTPYRPADAFFVPHTGETCTNIGFDYCTGAGTWLWYGDAGLQVLLQGASGNEFLTFFPNANTQTDGVYNGPYGTSSITFTVHDPVDVPEPISLALVPLGLIMGLGLYGLRRRMIN